jgi:polygalacturonase
VSTDPSRRSFLRTSGLLLGGVVVGGAGEFGRSATARADARHPHRRPDRRNDRQWRHAHRILERVRPPRFPNRRFNITDFGARPDPATTATTAIRRAIEACHRSGGGHVVVPAGTFLTGAIHLRSNVDLHLERGATLAFSQDPADYLPVVYTRWQGIELMNYSPFIYAFEQHNVAITGHGTLDGRADNQHWWPWKGSTAFGWQPGQPSQDADDKLSQQQADDGVPVRQRVFGAGHYLRPNFIQPYRCHDVLISDVRIIRSPMWEIHPVLSTNVTVQNVTVDSHGPNNDGCDPECCRDVVIQDCTFSTGDDCIAIKSGKNADGRRVNVPSEDIVIRRCTMADGHGGVTIGSEMTGGVRNVFAENLHMSSPDLQIALRLKTNSLRGGFIENVHLRDTVVGQVSQQAFLIDFFYEVGDDWPKYHFVPAVAGISLDHVDVGTADQAYYLVGYPTDHIRDITLTDCTFTRVAETAQVQYVDDLELHRVTVNGELVGVGG